MNRKHVTSIKANLIGLSGEPDLDMELGLMNKKMLAPVSLAVVLILFLFTFIRYLKWLEENQIA